MQLFLFVYTFLLVSINYYPSTSIKSDYRCLKGKFFCKESKSCIDSHLVSDGKKDCPNGEDEQVCKDDQFKCHSGRCISKSKLCDNFDNCGDNQDEDPAICFKEKCTSDSFLCALLLDRCVEKCTKHPKCLDFTDISTQVCSDFKPKLEVNCDSDEFKCEKEEVCISKHLQCDGKADCADESDEKFCFNQLNTSDDSFVCLNGDTIPRAWVCNGVENCPDNEDERSSCFEDASKNFSLVSTCGPNKFLCHTNEGQECLESSKLCDGYDDCLDLIDESDENCKSKDSCPNEMFSCRGQTPKCIPMSKVCDDIEDCPNGDDERVSSRTDCQKKSCHVENGGCNHICTPGVDRVANCECYEGYTLKSDRKTCEAGSEAFILFVFKGQIYEGRLGDVSSLRRLSFFENVNQSSSSGNEAMATWFATDRNVIASDNLQGHNRYIAGHSITAGKSTEYEVEPQWSGIVDFDYSYQLESKSGIMNKFIAKNPENDFSNGLKLVWSQNNPAFPGIFMIHDNLRDENPRELFQDKKIKVKPLSTPLVRSTPSDIEKIAMTALKDHNSSTSTLKPMSIAYDWVHGNIYWSNPVDRSISVVNIRSGWRRVLYTLREGHFASSLILDPRFSYLYWIEDFNDVTNIKIASMDGQDHSIFLANTGQISEIHIDFIQNELYVEKSSSGRIEAYNLMNGSNRRVVFENSSFVPRSINVFEDSIYFTDIKQNSLFQIDKKSGNIIRKVGNFPSPVFRIQHRVLRPSWLNRCYGNPCSHICLPSPLRNYPNVSSPFKCSCPEFWRLRDDQVTCEPVKNLALILKPSNLEEYQRISGSYNNIKMFESILHQSSQVDENLFWKHRYQILFGDKHHDPYLTAILVLLSIVMVCFFGVGLACITHHAVKQKIRKSTTMNLLNEISHIQDVANGPVYHALPLIPEHVNNDDTASVSAFFQDSSNFSMLIDPEDLPIETSLQYNQK